MQSSGLIGGRDVGAAVVVVGGWLGFDAAVVVAAAVVVTSPAGVFVVVGASVVSFGFGVDVWGAALVVAALVVVAASVVAAAVVALTHVLCHTHVESLAQSAYDSWPQGSRLQPALADFKQRLSLQLATGSFSHTGGIHWWFDALNLQSASAQPDAFCAHAEHCLG